MKKIMSFIFVVCLMAAVGAPLCFCASDFVSQADESPALEKQVVHIVSSPNGEDENFVTLDDFRNNQNGGTYNDTQLEVYLDEDISLSGTWQPIGTNENPFCGKFYGQGHRITFATTISVSNEQSIGFFGHTKNASIESLQLTGSFNLTMPSNQTSFFGTFVGYGENTTISTCELDSELSAAVSLNGVSTIGGFVGVLESGQIINCANYASFNVAYIDKVPYLAKIGGIVGSIKNVNSPNNVKLEKVLNFSSVNITLSQDSNVTPSFVFGGLVGTNEEASTQIFDCVFSGQLSGNNLVLQSGVIAGRTRPFEISNIMSIAYESTLAPFGEETDLDYEKQNIKWTSERLTYDENFYRQNSTQFVSPSTSQVDTFEWAQKTSAWDFDKVWRSVTTTDHVDQIRIQLFQKFTISVANPISPMPLNEQGQGSGSFAQFLGFFNENGDSLGTNQSHDCEFGEKISIKFALQDQNNENYYDLSEIKRDGINLGLFDKTIFVPQDDGSFVASGMKLSTTQENNRKVYVFTVEISNLRTGQYSFEFVPRKFNGYVLASENGQVKNSGLGNSAKKIERELNKNTVMEIEAVADSKYSFDKWELYYVSDNDDAITFEGVADKKWERFDEFNSSLYKSDQIKIEFGKYIADVDDQPYWTQTFLLVAYFKKDPLVLNFSFDNSVIEKLNINGAEITMSGINVELDKKENIRLDIYLRKGASLNLDEVETKIKNLFLLDTSPIVVSSSTDPSGAQVYQLSFFASAIDYSAYSSFSIQLSGDVVQEEAPDNTIWIVVGVVCGVILLAVIGVIIWLVIRRKKMSKLKDDYKRMYM